MGQTGFRRRIDDQTTEVGAIHTITRNGLPDTMEEFHSVITGQYRSMDDFVVPDFKRRRAAGEVFNNSLSYQKTVNAASGSLTWSYAPGDGQPGRPQGEYWHGVYELPTIGAFGNVPVVLSSVPPDVISTLEKEAITECIGNVRAPYVLYGVIQAEAQKTLELLRNPLSKVGKAISGMYYGACHAAFGRYQTPAQAKATMRRSARHAARFSDAMAAQWLKYRYGVMPNIYDAQGIIAAANHKAAERKTARATRVWSTTSESDVTGLLEMSGPNNGMITIGAHIQTTTVVHIRAGILYNESAALVDPYGLSLYTAPEVAWELLPYSFVYDWFANVGQYISSLRLTAQTGHLSRFLTKTVTATHVRTCTSATVNSPFSGWGFIVKSGGVGAFDSWSTTQGTRRAFSADERGLALNARLTTNRIMDAAALAIAYMMRGK